jgi:hypothetical protein
VGDEYRFGDYGYIYHKDKDTGGNFTFSSTGWGVYLLDKTKSTYASPLDQINDTYVVGMRFVYKNCSNLSALASDYKLPSHTDSLQHAFLNCKLLEYLPDTFVIPSTVDSMAGAFQNCTGLKALSPNFTISPNCSTTSNMFKGCSSLKTLPSGFKIPNGIVDIGAMFMGCSSLEYLNSDFTMPSQGVSNCQNMFNGCTSLKTLPTSFQLPSASYAPTYLSMFKDCTSLNLSAGQLVLPNVEALSTDNMFENCTSLTSFPINNFAANGSVHEHMYAGCTNISGTITITSDSDFMSFIDGTTKEITIYYAEDYQMDQMQGSCENPNVTFEKA